MRSCSRASRLMRSITVACCSWVPCEKFKRAQSMPSVMSLLNVSSSLDDGPTVTMILVLRIVFVSRGPYENDVTAPASRSVIHNVNK